MRFYESLFSDFMKTRTIILIICVKLYRILMYNLNNDIKLIDKNYCSNATNLVDRYTTVRSY